VLTTVLFTDIVGSTDRAAALGDARWREVVVRHDQIVRAQLTRHRGREINTTGDGFVATFDGPARAIRCAHAITEDVRPLELAVRAGLHTGECELIGEDVRGMAVNIGARIGALADAGEVLVSSTVKDLVIGSGIDFVDRGSRELKGVPGKWRLYKVAEVGASPSTRLANDERERRLGDRWAERATRRAPTLMRRVMGRGANP
jgi:class 3 adenylate cyclase